MRCQCGGRSEVGEVVREEEEDGLLLPSSPHGSSTLILILLDPLGHTDLLNRAEALHSAAHRLDHGVGRPGMRA